MSCTVPRTRLSALPGGRRGRHEYFFRPNGRPNDGFGRRADAVADIDGAAEFRRTDPHVVRLILDEFALEHVHRADEIGHEFRAWEFIDFGRRARLDDFAVIHDANAARQGHRFFLIVRHDNESHAQLVLQADQFELRVFAQFLVERAQRFIQQQQLGALHQRTGQRHALALAAGQLMRLALGELAHFHQVEHGGDALLDLLLG